MSKRPRRNHTPAFKVALAAIKGEMMLAQLAGGDIAGYPPPIQPSQIKLISAVEASFDLDRLSNKMARWMQAQQNLTEIAAWAFD